MTARKAKATLAYTARKAKATLAYDLPATPTLTVTVGGEAYEARLGVLAGMLDLPGLVDGWRALAEAGGDVAEVSARVEELDERTFSVVASVFGREGAERLVGGEHRLDVARMVAVLGVVAEVLASPEAASAMEAALPDVPDTADAD